MSALDLVVVDSGGANIASVLHACRRVGVTAELSRDAERVARADALILPGVGAAGPAMQRLREAGLVGLLQAWERPMLGVCLGMQLLYERSEEGDVDCLGLMPGTVAALEPSSGLRVPHMGWNRLQVERPHPLMDGLPEDAYVYFVHSYAAPVTDDTVASAEHGARFTALCARDRIAGCQFHPERSGGVGTAIVDNFVRAARATAQDRRSSCA